MSALVKQLDCVEIGKRLKVYHDPIVANTPNVRFIYQNALEYDFRGYSKLISNLPFHISEPFLELMSKHQFERMVLIIGQRFAHSMVNIDLGNITKLSLLAHCYFNTEILCEITPDAFTPSPNTMSVLVIVLVKSADELINDGAMYMMRQIFEQRDKKIRNSLKESIIRYSKKRGRVVTKKMAISLINQYTLQKIFEKDYLENSSNDELSKLYISLIRIDEELNF